MSDDMENGESAGLISQRDRELNFTHNDSRIFNTDRTSKDFQRGRREGSAERKEQGNPAHNRTTSKTRAYNRMASNTREYNRMASNPRAYNRMASNTRAYNRMAPIQQKPPVLVNSAPVIDRASCFGVWPPPSYWGSA
ncbi:adenosylhomocysteinase [Plakobranchus ocellatus]|uniref:Adenosylhomocysteinase n=1 Tax=Plakobranchus ocellatus TaxID=259542 RepID=A0AAV3XVW1_9GAST|nr:adenosylhomocysteinase [Plakobranchus ocellatus]